MVLPTVFTKTKAVSSIGVHRAVTEPVKPSKLFWIFLIGSFVGVIVEMIWCLMKYGKIASRSSMVLGPFNLVYGAGALVLFFVARFCCGKSRLSIFAIGTVAGTLVEYICSVLQEIFMGSVSWNYVNMPFNIDGRVNLLYSAFWGFLAIIWCLWVQPEMEKVVGEIPRRVFRPLTAALAIFMIVNFALSCAAVFRWGLRLDGIPATDTVALLLDTLFPNELMVAIYPNMLW